MDEQRIKEMLGSPWQFSREELSPAMRQLARERDALLAEVAALQARVTSLTEALGECYDWLGLGETETAIRVMRGVLGLNENTGEPRAPAPEPLTFKELIGAMPSIPEEPCAMCGGTGEVFGSPLSLSKRPCPACKPSGGDES